MFQELKMKSFKKNLPMIILFFAIGIALLVFAIPTIKTILGGKSNLDELAADQIHENMLVDGTVYGIYGWYAHTTETSGSTTKEVSKEYIIPVGENEYMGLVAPKGSIDACENLMNQFNQYLDGNVTELTNQFKVTGTILKMDSESLEFYHEYVGYDDMTADDQALFLPYYLKINFYGTAELSSLIIGGLIMVLFLFLGFFFLIRALGGHQQKVLKEYCKQHMATERLEQFYRTVRPVNGIRMNRDYILGISGDGATCFMPVSDFVWAYMHVHKTTKFYVITVSKTYSVMFCTKDGKRYQHGVKNEKQAEEVLDRVSKLYPWAAIGYTDDLDKAYRKNLSGFVQSINERKAQYADPYTEAYMDPYTNI